MRVLQLAYKLPAGLKDGGALSIYASAKSLMNHEGVSVKTLAMQLQTEEHIPFDDSFREFQKQTNLAYVKVWNKPTLAGALRNRFKPSSYLMSRFSSTEFENLITTTLKQDKFDVIILEHLYLTQYLELIRNLYQGVIILRAQNIEHKLWEQYHCNLSPGIKKFYLKNEIKKLERLEKKVVSQLDAVIALSNSDREFFESDSISSATIPIGFQIEPLKTAVIKEGNFYHLGSMDWRPNIEGMNWFYKEVLPLLNKDVEVRIAGKSLRQDDFKSKENFINDGEVENAKNYHLENGVMLVPLISGGGIRVKVIEALALGKAIISTPKGVEGLGLTHLENVFIAESPEAFADGINVLNNNKELRVKLGSAGFEFAEKNFSLEQMGKTTYNFLKQLTTNN